MTVSCESCNQNYWDWPASKEEQQELVRREVIQEILQEEKVLRLLSIDHIEESLTSDLEDNIHKNMNSSHRRVQHDDYWYSSSPHDYWLWSSSREEQEKAKRAERIKQILHEERIRQVLSAEHVEEKLLLHFGDKEKKPMVVSQTVSRNDHYWAEFNDQTFHYWAEGNDTTLAEENSYWFWPTDGERSRATNSTTSRDEDERKEVSSCTSQEENSNPPYWDWLAETHPFVQSSVHWEEIGSDEEEKDQDSEEAATLERLAEQRQRLFAARKRHNFQLDHVFQKEVTDMTSISARSA